MSSGVGGGGEGSSSAGGVFVTRVIVLDNGTGHMKAGLSHSERNGRSKGDEGSGENEGSGETIHFNHNQNDNDHNDNHNGEDSFKKINKVNKIISGSVSSSYLDKNYSVLKGSTNKSSSKSSCPKPTIVMPNVIAKPRKGYKKTIKIGGQIVVGGSTSTSTSTSPCCSNINISNNNVINRNNSNNNVVSNNNYDVISIGFEAINKRGAMELTYPLTHGIVTSWEDLEIIWRHVFYNELRVDPTSHPVIVTEAPLNPMKNREKLVSLLFDTFLVPCCFVAIQAVMSLYGMGRTTGVVVDAGDGVIHIVPCFEGYCMTHAIKRMNIGGRDITEYFGRILQKSRGYVFESSSEKDILDKIKIQCCYVRSIESSAIITANNGGSTSVSSVSVSGGSGGSSSTMQWNNYSNNFDKCKRDERQVGPLGTPGGTRIINPYHSPDLVDRNPKTKNSNNVGENSENNSGNSLSPVNGCKTPNTPNLTSNAEEMVLEMPDGSFIVCQDERWEVCECLFDPLGCLGKEIEPLPLQIRDSIRLVDIDLRRDLYRNIVLSGGTTLFPGFRERLLEELKLIAPGTCEPRVLADKDRRFLVWAGACVLAEMPNFTERCLLREEYDEIGLESIRQRFL